MNEENSKIQVPEHAIDKETAENEFDRWTKAMKIKMNRFRNTNDKSDLEEDKALVVELIMDGTVTLDDERRMVYHSEEGKQFTFYRPKGQQLAEIDKVKETDKVKQSYALAGAITRTSAKSISELYTSEVIEMGTIASLFLV